MTTMPALASIADLIECRASYRDGRPHIAGTGISVGSIGLLWQEGLSPEQIAIEYPALDLEQVHAAIAFYLHNRAAIDADLEQQALDHDRAAAAQAIARSHGDPTLG